MTAMTDATASTPLPFARPSIDTAEEEAVLRVLRSGWITTGKEALAFETEFADFLAPSGTDPVYCLSTSSATAGLHLAMEALGVNENSLVFVPTLTFTATAETARYLGAELVFVDSMGNSPLMDLDDLTKKIRAVRDGKDPYNPALPLQAPLAGKKPALIAAVHYGGLPCDMVALRNLADRENLALIEDAAHSFPSWVEGQGYAGTLSDIGVFSFYATKTMTCAEGGMIATRNREARDRMTTMRLHGIDRPVWARYTDARASWDYDVVAPGYKYNLNDILAAMGRVQLAKAPGFLAERRAIAARYDEAFSRIPGIEIPPSAPSDARHLYPVRIGVGKDRDAFAKALQERGIGVSVHFRPLHCMSYWQGRYALTDASLPHARDWHKHSLSLPIWQGMSSSDVERVIRAVHEASGSPA